MLRLAGAREWNWLAPPVGISAAMLIAVPATQLPGGCATAAVLLGILTIAAVVWCWRLPAHRPPAAGLLAVAPVALLVLVPFLAAGRAGILGTSLNNDMGSHMLFVETYLSDAVANVTPLRSDYPLGPHAMVALISEGFGIRVDHAFAGWTMALPILSAWTAVALVRRTAWLGQVIAATVVGIPFLIAAYYGEGSFKEVLQAGLVLAVALLFSGCGPTLGRGRWVPFALLLGGILSVYSVTGLPWPAAIAGLWLFGTLVQWIVAHGTKGLKEAILRELPAVGIGLAVFLAVILPQAGRIHDFVAQNLNGNGIITPKDNPGNLVGPLPGWEAFGVWNNPDFRLPASPAFTGGMWTAFVLALVVFGAVWAIRSGRWLLPLAAGASMVIWALSISSQSIYVVAKGLVIASPLLLAVAVLPLVDSMPDRIPRSLSGLFQRLPGRPLSWGLALILALVLVLRVGVSDVRALRVSPVGPTDHAEQLRELRPLLRSQPTLFLGNDDFIEWELAGVPVGDVVANGAENLPIRPEKEWSPGQPLDFDSVDAATLNKYDWVVTTRDAAGSAPPPQLHPVRTTDSYVLWHRVGRVDERAILAEGYMPGAVLDCSSPEGRAIERAGGVAAIRAASVVTPAPSIAADQTMSMELDLVPGTWELETPYTSPLPVTVTAPGLRTTLPANLDRPGSRWRIGRIDVREPGPVTVTFHVEEESLTPATATAVLGSVIATPLGTERIVPMRLACDSYVDWYRSAKD